VAWAAEAISMIWVEWENETARKMREVTGPSSKSGLPGVNQTQLPRAAQRRRS